MRFGSGEWLDEFDGYLTAVSENSPCKSDWLVVVFWTNFFVDNSMSVLKYLPEQCFFGAGLNFRL